MVRKTRNVMVGKITLLFVIATAAVLWMSPVSADITIYARGGQSYYYGEEVVLYGQNSESDYTYLFISGNGIPESGGVLTTPLKNVVSQNPDTFTRAQVRPDKTWEYIFYTDNLGLDPGSYTIYAVSQPETKDRVSGVKSDTVSIILKRPFVSAGFSPSTVPKGQPFTITGYAEGDPGNVHVWIFGDNYEYDTTVPVSAGSTYSFNASEEIAANLPGGECYLIVQHPMQNNRFELVVDGDWVREIPLSDGEGPAGGTNIFQIRGPDSLYGSDAVRALTAAFGNSTVDDTYVEVRFTVDDAGITAPEIQPTRTFPVPPPTQTSPLQVAPFGAIVLIMGIVAWRRG